jgi:hypothetical protein
LALEIRIEAGGFVGWSGGGGADDGGTTDNWAAADDGSTEVEPGTTLWRMNSLSKL